MHNYNKAKYITQDKSKEVNHLNILKSQLMIKKEKNEIYVLSTFPLLVMDYNFEKTISVLKIKLKNNFIELSDKE